jgi:hypothetical protein
MIFPQDFRPSPSILHDRFPVRPDRGGISFRSSTVVARNSGRTLSAVCCHTNVREVIFSKKRSSRRRNQGRIRPKAPRRTGESGWAHPCCEALQFHDDLTAVWLCLVPSKSSFRCRPHPQLTCVIEAKGYRLRKYCQSKIAPQIDNNFCFERKSLRSLHQRQMKKISEPDALAIRGDAFVADLFGSAVV